MSEDDLARLIGKNINWLLDNKNINQNELAVILGVSESAVGKWVLGKSVPRMGTIQKIADYFGVKKSDLMEHKIWDLDKTPNNISISRQALKDEEKILLDCYGELGEEEKRFFLRQIQLAAKERGEHN